MCLQFCWSSFESHFERPLCIHCHSCFLLPFYERKVAKSSTICGSTFQQFKPIPLFATPSTSFQSCLLKFLFAASMVSVFSFQSALKLGMELSIYSLIELWNIWNWPFVCCKNDNKGQKSLLNNSSFVTGGTLKEQVAESWMGGVFELFYHHVRQIIMITQTFEWSLLNEGIHKLLE